MVRVVIAAVTALVLPLAAAPPGAARQEDEPAPIDAAALQHFVDAFFTATVVEEPVPGAAVVAVQGGEFVVVSGYGVPDVGSTRSVDPRRTRFGARALSQAVTAAAALQLTARDQLDLHADVNRYLDDVTVPDTYPQPVTLASLLTHTAGLDGATAGTVERRAEDVRSLEEHLAATALERTAPPGELIRYTDQAATLVGLLIEEASGRSFSRYVRDELLLPLGMRRSTFAPPERGDVAVGYVVRDGGLERAPAGHFNTAPAAGLVTSGTDMAAFIAMILARGAARDGEQVVAPEAVDGMRTQQFTHDPRLPGVTYGLFEHVENGVRALVHSGAALGFSSLLLVLPEHDFGLYAVYNSDYAPVRAAFVSAFFDEFFPPEPQPSEPWPGDADDLARFVGSYVVERDRTAFVALDERILEQVTVAAPGDGTLSYDGRRWRRVGPRYFEAVDDPDRHLAFGGDDAITHLFPEHGFGNGHGEALVRLPWDRTTAGVAALTAGFALAFVLVLVVAAWRRRRGTAPHPVLRGLVLAVAGADLAFLVLLPAGMAVYDDGIRFSFGVPPAFPVLLTVPLVALVLAVLLLVAALVGIGLRRVRPGPATWSVTVALLGIAFGVFVARLNLLGPAA